MMRASKEICVRHLWKLLMPAASFLIAWTLILSTGAFAGEIAPVQSAARPFGLEIAGPVQLAGSDARSQIFQTEILPSINGVVNTVLLGHEALGDGAAVALNPGNTVLATDYDVRVYFVGEGAGFRNSVGYNTGGGGIGSGTPTLLFPDASTNLSYYNGTGIAERTTDAPLLPGDFVDLNRLAAGTRLDFFIIANGANGGRTVYSTDMSVNRDGLQHAISLNARAAALIGSPYLIFGFEDLWGGGDNDFNDLIFAADISSDNVNALISAPEPSTMLILASFLVVMVWTAYHRGMSAV